MTVVTSSPCRRGHTGERNQHGQCVECLRESRRAYKRRKAGKAPTAQPESTPAPAVVAAPALSTATLVASGTFLAVAQEWLAAQDNVAPKTAIKRAYLLAQLQAIHNRPIAELTTPDYVRALKGIEAVGDRRETAHRAGMFAGQITRYAMNHGYVTFNALPMGQLRGTLKPIKVESHAAITDPVRFGTLLDNIGMYAAEVGSRNHPSVAAAMSLAPYLFVRPGELRSMEWREINFERAEWLIPAEKMKMRRPHLVPLSTQALAILREQHKNTGKGRYVFPAKRLTRHTEELPLSENAFREALGAVLVFMRAHREEHTMHGFRSSASTLLNGELGIDSALIELQMAHVKGDRVQGIYDRSQRIPERRELMQKWADYIDRLRSAAARS